MTEIMQVSAADLMRPGETGVQESDLLDRLPDGKASEDAQTDAVRLVSLGCMCAPKLSFKKMGRGAETLPFDWMRTRIDGVLHYLRNDFEGFYDWTTKQHAPTGMTIYRGYYQAFWHDNPTEEAMRERYDRRIKRYKEIDASEKPVLFVRSCCTHEELPRAPELLAELKTLHGQYACLLMIIDFQSTANGAAIVDGHPDILIWYMSGAIHSENADGAPYTEPVRAALDWAVGRSIQAMQFVSMEKIVECADHTMWGMTGLEGVAAFEDKPYNGETRVEHLPGPAPKAAPAQPAAPAPEVDPAAEAAAEAAAIARAPAVESDAMEAMGAFHSVPVNDGIDLVSLGCFCGPKLTFQQLGRGAETLPFDWLRSSLDGIIHFIKKDFDSYYDYKTRRAVPNSHMVMYRSAYHSFWHDNPDSPEMREKYDRRIARFKALRDKNSTLLFVRAISSMDELLRADELLAVLSEKFGPQACLLLIADFQPSTLGMITVEGYEDLLVYFQGSKDRGAGADLSAPYKKAVSTAIAWVSGDPFEAGEVEDLKALRALGHSGGCDLANFGVPGDGLAFEPQTGGEEPAAVASPARARKNCGTGERATGCGQCSGGLWKLLATALSRGAADSSKTA